MAFVMDHRHSSSGSDQSYHSATAEEDHWVHSKNIGAGGFGVVKLFVNQTTREMIVLKECRLMNLSRETLERWYGEVEILKRLDHPNIVKAQNVPEGLNCSPMSNTPFICMEYCDGGDLRQVLRDPENCCGLPEKTIRQICHDVNQGIRFLHSQRVIHRDLKPENILIKKIDPNRVVYKLTDFGYAKSYDKSSVCTSLVGTVQYVAPEVLKDKKYHSSVDFWSFGMVVFECVTGKRPFLHGDPAVAIGWVDWVSKKGPKDIHIFWGEDEFRPVYSSKLPQPHRLCKPFEGHITSWLQTALHYNPDMRGGRRVATEDAPCLTNMDHILNTQMVNAVCTSTGDVNSYVITNSSLTMEDLCQNIQCSTSVPPSEQYLVLRNGRMPLPSDPASMCIQEGDYNLGEVYVFTTALEPSFKMMHSTSHAVSTLTAYGDEQIKQDDRRDVYSHVFFHIREQYSLFHRLHCAHEAMLTQLTQQCREVTQEQQALSHAHLRVEALTSFIKEMHVGDSERMRAIHAEHRALPPAILSRTLIVWDKNQEQLEQKTQFLRSLHSEIANIRLEADTLLHLSTDLQTSHTENEERFHDYYKLYVVKARDIYQDTKLNRGYSTVGRMQDVLLGATQDAETIIREWLNGLNFGRQFVALRNHLSSLANKRSNISAAEREVMEINEKRRKDVWELLLHERKSTPFTSLTNFPAQPEMHSVTPEIAQFARQFSHASKRSSSGSIRDEGEYQRSNSRWSGSSDSYKYSGQKSSVESSIELTDSLRRFSRCVSQEENDRVVEKNSQLLRRLSSLVESNGRSLDGEGGGAANGGEGSITGSHFRQHSAPINARGSYIGTPQQR